MARKEYIQKHSSSHFHMAHNDLIVECSSIDLVHKESSPQNPQGNTYRSHKLEQQLDRKYHTDNTDRLGNF